MPSKYTETQVNTAAYQRCKEIRIYNPYGEKPTVQFVEEQLLKRPNGGVIHDEAGTITKPIGDYNETFPVYNPMTQVKTGQTASIAQLYAMIWSVYMNEAVLRDAYLAKVAVGNAGRDAEIAAQAAYEASIRDVSAAFDTQDAADLAAATADAETKATQDEKDAVMAAYAAAKQTKVTAVDAELTTLRTDYATAKAAAATKLVTDAQAAYDAVINA